MNEPKGPDGAMCVDDLDLQALVDGELEGARLELAHLHLGACARCAARLREIREDALAIQDLLGREDEAAADAAAAALVRAEAACRRMAATTMSQRRLFTPRFGFLLTVAAAIALAAVWQAWETDLTAAPGRILDEAMVREQAWMYQPGKVLHWVVESEISGSPRVPDGRYRSEHWLSTVAGAEGAIIRRTDAQGRLVFATWRRQDGSVVAYLARRPEPLRIEPSAEAIRAEMGRLSSGERAVLQAFLDRRAQEGELSIRSGRFARWFLDAANSRGGARAERIRTPDGGEGFYLRLERGRDARLDRGVARLVIETYIDSDGFRRYRQRSQRDLEDGGVWIEDARWTAFREADLASFEAHTLEDLLRAIPPVRVTVGELARRHLGRGAAMAGQ